MPRWRIEAVGAVAVAAVVLGLYLSGRPEAGPPLPPPVTDGPSPDVESAGESDSPFAAVDGAAGAPVEAGTSSAEVAPSGDAPAARPAPVAVSALEGPVDLQRLGRGEPLSEEALAALVARLEEDPDLLAALIDEFRAERDPARLRRLSNVLDELGGEPAVADLAEELVYSGDELVGETGLWLLAQLPPGSGRARDVASGLMSSETDGRVLVGALNALGSPASADAGTRASLAGQVALLAAHEDPAVRRGSLNQLSRWTADETHVPLIVEGLSDVDPSVRETAAYALVGRDPADGTARRELFAIIEDEREAEGPRRAAVLALNRMPLDESEKARVRAVQRSLAYR